MSGRDPRNPDAATLLRREHAVGGHSPDERRVAAWIGAAILIEGNVSSSEDTTIAGQVDGDVAVRQNTLVIAAEGRIHGDIVARAVVVHGEVAGNITAEWKLEVHETGSITGDIATSRLVIAEGAVLEGRVQVATTPVPLP
jgi:cytoskeletal protein CcmA (bactofilin family)